MAYESEFASILREFMASPEETIQDSPPAPPMQTWTKASPQIFVHLENQPKIQAPKRAYLKEKHKGQRRRAVLLSPQKPVPKKIEEPIFKWIDLSSKTQEQLKEFFKLANKTTPQSMSLLQLKKVYRKLAKAYHPDRQDSQASAEKFHKVSELYRSITLALSTQPQKSTKAK